MTRAEAPLPSLPLWAAALIALSTEATLFAGLSQWPARRASEPPEVPIEVSLVPAPVLADSAAVGAVGGLLDAETPEPEIAPEPEPKPEPEPLPEPTPVTPEPPAPVPVRAPDPVPERVAVVQPEPKPKPVSKPKRKLKPKVHSKPRPKAKQKVKAKPKAASKPASGAGPARAPASPAGAASRSTHSAGKGPATRGGSSPAAYLSNPRPGYPDSARRQRQEGTVHLRVLVGTSGQASQVVVAGSSGVSSLDQAALRAVRRWRFKPARQNGRPISAWVRVPVRFTLNR